MVVGSHSRRKQRLAFYTTALLLVVLVIIPFLWALRVSLEPTFSTAVSIIPKRISLVNYGQLLFYSQFPRWILNSLIFAGAVTLLNVLLDSMAGYVLARQNMPGSKLMFLAVLGLLMVPSQITLVPLYLMLSKLNLVDTYTGLILPLAANAFGIFVMKQFIQSIPRDYDEAAMIDGASKFRLFLWVILPLARPALLVVAVTMFMETWNNFIFPLVMITNNQMKTVTLGLADFTYATLNVNWGVTMAGSLLGALPAILLFVVLNRYFMEGLSLGGGIRG